MSSPLIQYILARLRERSTWLGLIGLATACGLVLTPDQTAAVVGIGSALAGALASFTPDKPG